MLKLEDRRMMPCTSYPFSNKNSVLNHELGSSSEEAPERRCAIMNEQVGAILSGDT